ncbi:hypothetical protein QCA50_010288 [Cerrena zonata]|uniref:Uncharacterized protein n=1 Tax=Cerrena zonata TaxID=2478898 RepID=A0AAW0G9R8_9APHY
MQHLKRILDLLSFRRESRTAIGASGSVALPDVYAHRHEHAQDNALPVTTSQLSTPEPYLFLFQIIVNPEIYDTIFDMSSARTLVRLLRTCHTTNQSVRSYMRRAFNINRRLSRYFPDPIAFRYLQACTGMLISGSTALQFFDRTFYPESDLDLYVAMPWGSNIGHFVLGHGYQFMPTPVQPRDFDAAISHPRVTTAGARYGNFKGIAGVFTFEKGQPGGRKLKVQIMVAVRSPMEIILQFHSTCVLNVIAFDKAYCLYPRATLEERLMVVCTTRNDDVIEGVYRRYVQRGWFLIRGFHAMHLFSLDRSLSSINRWIDDRFSWSILLPYDFQDGITSINSQTDPLTQDPVSVSGWTLTARGNGINDPAAIEFHRVEDRDLFYHYVLESNLALHTPSMIHLMDMATVANKNGTHDQRYIDNRFIHLVRAYYEGRF